MSKQLQILKALDAHLVAHVTGWEDLDGNPIVYDLGGRIWRGRTTIAAEDAQDALSILEAPKPINGDPADDESVVRWENWTLLLQGFPKDDKANPSDPAYYMKAAVEKALSRLVLVSRSGNPAYPDEYRLGGLIGGLIIGQGVVRPASQEVSRLAMFYIPLVVKLKTDVSNP